MANKFRIEFEDGAKRSASVKIKAPKDIVMFVAGTTDPLNTKGLNHEADKSYWRAKKEDLNNLWKDVKALKPQFLDLHIEDKFFSWSGDNGHEDRVKGAERLLDLFLRVYKNWTGKEVFLHLIGHSHGGNVINEFTDIIAKDKNFPKHWKIKTLTYLSTPFFKKQHQLNHDKIHPDCKVINVHNEYDITQRFVADFTLKNLEILIANFNSGAFDEALKRIKETDFQIYEQLGGSYSVNNHTEGPHMWRQTVILLDGIDQLMKVLINNVKSFKTKGLLSTKRTELLTHLVRIQTWATTRAPIFEANSETRDGDYGRAEFFEDLNLVEVLGIVNTLFAIENENVESSYLLNLLNDIFQSDEAGIVDEIDDTSWTPERQINKKYSIKHVPIFKKDSYHSRNKKSNYDEFIAGIETAMLNNGSDVREVLMRLLSQIIPQDKLTGEDNIPDTLDSLMWLYTDDDIDNGLAAARDNLRLYGRLINRFNANLITTKDLENDKIAEKPGSLAYLATKSHSLSHTKLWKDVEEGLRASFGSGENPGYKG